MRIDPESTIADIPALKIRALLKRCPQLEVRDVCNALRLDPGDARLVLCELEAEDYLARKDGLDIWYPTVRGNALAMATTAPPVTRATAARALAGLLRRVAEVNEARRYLYRVRAVVVFGSYLGASARVNDVDVAVGLSPRHDDMAMQNAEEMERWQGARRTFRTFTDMLGWPRDEVWLFLKSRSRVLSVHDLDNDAPLIRSVRHEVMFGAWE